MKTPRVVKGGVLEDKTSEVAMGCDDVIGFFLLSEFVSIVL
jgi:hypothetical protein